MGQSGQQAAATQATEQNMEAMLRLANVATPAYKKELGFIQAELAGGEPEYAKAGFANLRGSVSEDAQKAEQEAYSTAFGGRNAPQGGAALATIGDIASKGGSHEARGLSSAGTTEALTMMKRTSDLLGLMSGQGATGLGTAVEAGGIEARAIAHMRDYNPTTAALLGTLSGAASIYAGLNTGTGAPGTLDLLTGSSGNFGNVATPAPVISYGGG